MGELMHIKTSLSCTGIVSIMRSVLESEYCKVCKKVILGEKGLKIDRRQFPSYTITPSCQCIMKEVWLVPTMESTL